MVKKLPKKTCKKWLAFVVTGSVLVVVLVKVFWFAAAVGPVKYGVTFSPHYAIYLNLDWQKTYLALLDDLQVKNLRLPTYWDQAEPKPGQYDFSQADFMLAQAQKREAKVLLVLGERQPRWPECQIPGWARTLTVFQRQQQTLEFIKTTVKKYQGNQAIWAWQVENEPFVSWFGQNCDKPDGKFLEKEISLVKKMDSRPVIVTDSGEWSNWISPMKDADILGISLYRKSYNQQLSLYIPYPFFPWMYTAKSNLVKSLFAPQNQETIISELQAEPWFVKGVMDTSLVQQEKLFTVGDFKNNVEFARQTGFEKDYLWGVEWWYFMAKNGYPGYLDYARTLF